MSKNDSPLRDCLVERYLDRKVMADFECVTFNEMISFEGFFEN